MAAASTTTADVNEIRRGRRAGDKKFIDSPYAAQTQHHGIERRPKAIAFQALQTAIGRFFLFNRHLC
jgi:hypothetical protein